MKNYKPSDQCHTEEDARFVPRPNLFQTQICTAPQSVPRPNLHLSLTCTPFDVHKARIARMCMPEYAQKCTVQSRA
eukprot:3509783-Rhodomonas_salina.2